MPHTKKEIEMKPFTSPKEREEVFNSVMNETIRVTGCSRENAEKRINALFASGILNDPNASPSNPYFQMRIDEFMFGEWSSVEDQLPLDTGNYLVIDPNAMMYCDKIVTMRFDAFNKQWLIESDTVHPSHWKKIISPK